VTALTFRPATAEDLSLINRLMREGKAYWGYSEEGVERFMKAYGIPDAVYFEKNFGFVAELGQDVVGFYLFSPEETPPFLDHFVLSTHFIGKGYGRQLWEHCVQQARAKGWQMFGFVSDPHTLGFYEHMGATVIGELPMVTLPGHMAPKMQFSLRE
jgi:GNAT superfamily N-acetyltransferase